MTEKALILPEMTWPEAGKALAQAEAALDDDWTDF